VTRWEFKYKSFAVSAYSTDPEGDLGRILREVDALGEEGWEPVGMIQGYAKGQFSWLMLKRPTQ
jgi:hypothetical protein